jgi:diguanylate cyclase (GGDEF)-like protein
MSQLSRIARGYLVGSYLLGLAALVWLLQSSSPLLASPRLWALAAGLLALAAVAQILVVLRAGSSYSDHLTPVPLFAAFLLLPPSLLAIVVILSFLPEWRWYRRQWYLQSFTIAAWAVALALGRGTLFLLTGHTQMETVYLYPVQDVVLALLVVLATQTLLLVGFLWTTNGQTLAETGLFAPWKLFIEAALLCVGWVLAAAWLVDPLYGVVALVPLALIFQALHVPNLKVEASTDPKTGLANIRYFDDVLERELDRSRRSYQPFSLLMCDLDDLRRINNTYGHQAGDAVIAAVATTIRHSIRDRDLAARFGGEEFCILLADTEGTAARVIAERIRVAVEQGTVRVGRSGQTARASVCIGVASYPLHGSTPETLLREADLALYQGKRDGRNRVVLAGCESRGLAAEGNRPGRGPIGNGQVREVHPLRRFVNEATRSLYAIERRATAPREPSPGAVSQPTPPGKTEPPSPLHRMLFNWGMVLAAAEVGKWTFEWLTGGVRSGMPFEWLLLPAVAAGLAYYVVNHLFLSIVRGLGERRPPGAVGGITTAGSGPTTLFLARWRWW